MTKEEALNIVKLLSALESWAFSTANRLPDYLHDDLCAADDSDDMDGGGYGSVDIAEILSAEVEKLRDALAQPAQEPVARVTGVYGGRFTYEPLNRAMVLPINMALYSSPQENT